MLFVMFSRGCRVFRPFNHEGREVDAITRWRLRSCRQRIEPAVFPSGTTRTNATTMCAADLGDGHVKSKILRVSIPRDGPDQVSDEAATWLLRRRGGDGRGLASFASRSREQIRNTVMRTVAIAIFLAVVFFRWKRRP
jgi:hypothetical protein